MLHKVISVDPNESSYLDFFNLKYVLLSILINKQKKERVERKKERILHTLSPPPPCVRNKERERGRTSWTLSSMKISLRVLFRKKTFRIVLINASRKLALMKP